MLLVSAEMMLFLLLVRVFHCRLRACKALQFQFLRKYKPVDRYVSVEPCSSVVQVA